jgi:hypothetical protein
MLITASRYVLRRILMFCIGAFLLLGLRSPLEALNKAFIVQSPISVSDPPLDWTVRGSGLNGAAEVHFFDSTGYQVADFAASDATSYQFDIPITIGIPFGPGQYTFIVYSYVNGDLYAIAQGSATFVN